MSKAEYWKAMNATKANNPGQPGGNARLASEARELFKTNGTAAGMAFIVAEDQSKLDSTQRVIQQLERIAPPPDYADMHRTMIQCMKDSALLVQHQMDAAKTNDSKGLAATEEERKAWIERYAPLFQKLQAEADKFRRSK